MLSILSPHFYLLAPSVSIYCLRATAAFDHFLSLASQSKPSQVKLHHFSKPSTFLNFRSSPSRQTKVKMVGKKLVALAALASSAAAQTGSAITIIADSSLSGHGLTTAHIGAGQSIVKASDSAGDPSFIYNSTASMIQSTAIVSDFNVPCFVVNQPSYFAPTAGPLECGVTYNQSADYAIASLTGGSTIAISGVTSWWSCTVNTYTYGNMSLVIVGSWGSGTPSGPGIGSDCVAITSLQLGSSSNTTTSGASSPTTTTAPAGSTPVYSNGTATTTMTYQLCNTCPIVTTTCGGSCPTPTTITTTNAAGSPTTMTYIGSDVPDSSNPTATAVSPNSGGGSSSSNNGGSSDSGSNTVNPVANGGTATPSSPTSTTSMNPYQGGAESLKFRSSNSLFALAAVFAIFAILF